MPTFKVTKSDMLRSKVVTPSWYSARCTKCEFGEAKTDGSEKWAMEFVIVGGPFDSVPIPHTVSAKAPGFAVNLIEALSGKKLTEEGGEFQLESAVGKTVSIFVNNEKYQNRITNKIADFRAA